MKFHIVGNGETVEDILRGYDLTIDELKNENKHIRIWNKLIPGTKLKIPVLTESIVEDINEIEPFIEDYYPKIKIEENNQIINEFEDNNESVDINEIIEQQNYLQDPVLEPVNEEINEPVNKTDDKIQLQENNNVVYNKYYRRYVYPYPYYYRPIIYVIPRK